MNKLKYDKDKLDFVEDKRSFWYYFLNILKFILFTAILVAVYYLVFSLFFNTKEQKQMRAETKMIQQEYQRLEGQADLLEGVVGELQTKDEQIYRDIFNSSIPDFSFSSDTFNISNLSRYHREPLIYYTRAKTAELENIVDYTDSILNKLLLSLENEDVVDKMKNLPSILPIADFHLHNVGASLGQKMHPFYKSIVFHQGLDFIAPQGTDVIATASGVVESVVRSKTSQGTKIVLNHQNGYKTTYSHLSDVLVKKGTQVNAGKVIARVGNTGMSLVPHLHYEVIYDEQYLDPLNFLMKELDVDQFREIILVAVNTGQSLD